MLVGIGEEKKITNVGSLVDLSNYQATHTVLLLVLLPFFLMDGIIAEGLFTNNNNLNVMATEHLT